MDIYIICFVAFLAAILTFFSGFGLGTLLTPVFMLFFPVDIAITLTAIVHFFNNIFKLIIVGKYAKLEVVLSFGIPAVLTAILGSWILLHITDLNPLFTYQAFDHEWTVYPVKFLISVLLIIFASIDLIPYFNKLQFDKKHLLWGGILSGFFGGLSGNQGALRSAFLIKAGLSKESFVATAVVISTCVDFTRLSIYATRFTQEGIQNNIVLVFSATVSAIAGAYLGHILLKKATIIFIQKTVAIMLIILSMALGMGFI